MSDYRELRLRVANEGLRTETFHGREHRVVPVVALVEGVLHACNSDEPELVLAEEFGRFPSAWNGNPVVLNHPQDEKSGLMLSANSPEVLEKYQIGTIFRTNSVENRLKMEAYLDLSRVANVGEKAQQLLDRLEKNGTIEISVGAYLQAERSAGLYKGKRYARVWRNIVPDHLAFLESGSTGACSNEAGCGAGVSRAAIHVVTKEGFTLEGDVMPNGKKEEAPKSLLERIKEFMGTLEETPAPKPAEAAAPTAAAEGCGCGGHKQVSAEGAEGGKVHKNAERITALIANPKTPWSEHDREYLQTVTDERLATFEAHMKPEPKPEPAPAAAAAAPTKVEIKLEDLPAAWQETLKAAQAAEAANRTGLITKLAAAQKGFSKEDLEGWTFEALQKFGKVVLKDAEVVDFSAAAGGRTAAASADDEEFADDAPDLIAGVRALRGVK